MVAVLVDDQCVVERHLLFEHVEQVILDAALQPEHDVEVAQTDVGIDEHDARAALRERRAEVGGGRGFPDAAFPRRYDDRSSQFRSCTRRSARARLVSSTCMSLLTRFHGIEQAPEKPLTVESA